MGVGVIVQTVEISGDEVKYNVMRVIPDTFVESRVATASEDLTAGDYVYFYLDTTVYKVAKAIATSIATIAVGFVIQNVTAGQPATVYLEGLNTLDNSYNGTMPTSLFLSDTVAGKSTTTMPTDVDTIVQQIGKYTGSGVTFEPNVNWING